jgi:tetraprenyl-beta-curcumene synthase
MAAYPDPAPVTARQLAALGRSATLELGWGLRAVRHELKGWRTRALAISDPVVRRDAIAAQEDKRVLVDGAALFWTLPRRRSRELLRLLVAFQTLANYLDNASERAAAAGEADAGTAAVLVAALDVGAAPVGSVGVGSDGDDGYLAALAEACRAGCASLPGYWAVRGLLLTEAARARSMDIEHDHDPLRRARRMRDFSATEYGAAEDTRWWEPVAGSSSLLTTIVLLALAADPHTPHRDLAAAVDAYTSAAIASALLDSYVDQLDDPGTSAHNYLTYYASPQLAIERLATLTERMMHRLGALHDAERHLVIATSMTAMFLSSDAARSPGLAQDSERLAAGAGTLTRALVPVLRTWRVANRRTAG